MIAEAVRSEIVSRLAEIEQEEHVRIFYACESGSRAWGKTWINLFCFPYVGVKQ